MQRVVLRNATLYGTENYTAQLMALVSSNLWGTENKTKQNLHLLGTQKVGETTDV